MTAEKNYLERELEELIRTDPKIWRFLRESSLDGVWYWDLTDPEQEYMSPEFWENFGYDPSTKRHLASEWQHLIFPEDLEIAKTNVAAHIADPNYPYDQIVRYKRADGKTAWVRCRGIAVRDDDGNALRLLGAHNDLTALMNEQREAKSSNRLLTQIMNAAQSAILGLDKDGNIVAINRAGRHMLGGISDDLPFPWPDNVWFADGETVDELEASRSPLHRALAGAVLKGEVAIMTRAKGEDLRYVQLSSSPVDDEGAAIQCVVIIDDVSEHEINRQRVERASRLEALGQLTGGIAHDFNNLLATIQYALQLSLEETNTEQRISYVDTALRSVERGADLTKRLLTFAKRHPGTANSKHVASLISDFYKLATPLIEANIDIDCEVEDESLFVYCNEAQLENALLNLVLNSRDAIMRSGKGHKITVQARGISELDGDIILRNEQKQTFVARGLHAERRADQNRDDGTAHRYVEISVTDNGPGMNDEVKRRAIDPFFTTKASNSGTGLGLSMVYGFVQQSDGELRIYSETGVGTTVRLILPRGSDEGGREHPKKRLPQAQGKGEQVLIVEDEPGLLEIMEDLVNSLGYEAHAVPSAKAALERLAGPIQIDLVITDVVMPGGMGGFELARQIREDYPEVPIMYMSGYTGFSESEMADVVAPMIQKPCPPAELAGVIRMVLNDARTS